MKQILKSELRGFIKSNKLVEVSVGELKEMVSVIIEGDLVKSITDDKTETFTAEEFSKSVFAIDTIFIEQNSLDKSIQHESVFLATEDFIEKARSGIYANTAENRKLGRVGQKFGSKKEVKELDQSEKPQDSRKKLNDPLNKEEIINLLKTDVQAFNRWRKENNYKRIDLEFVNLKNVNLENVNLKNVNLVSANLENVNFKNANLVSVDLENANLKNANLVSVDLENANLRYTDLVRANLENANLRYTDLTNANSGNAILVSADLTNATLENVNLENANLANAILVGVNLENVNLKNANLAGIKLIGTNLE